MKNTLWLMLILVAPSLAFASDWPGFRGPFGNGVSPKTTLPLKWGPDENIAWKMKLPGPGASSPIVWQDQVFVTCFTGKKANELVRHVFAYDRKSGKERWHREFPAPLPENDYQGQVTQHGFTTSTPVTDGKRLFIYFGRGGVHALDLDGKDLWHTELGDAINVFGSGSSPILWRDRLIVNAVPECRCLVSLDQAAGNILWKTVVNGLCWSMPIVVDVPAKEKGGATAGRQEIVLNATAGMYGYDPEKGTELWSVDNVAGYNGTTPVVRNGIVYAMNQGLGDKEFLAVRVGGQGDVNKSHIVWSQTKAGAPYCSPLLIGDRLFYFSSQAVVMSAADGKVITQKRLPGIERLYGSPIAAGDKILLFTRNQGAYILSADDKLTEIAHNDLGDDSFINASPALVDGQIFIRSNQYLYCIGQATGK
jgi:outer membrane protein assembly factor BamB